MRQVSRVRSRRSPVAKYFWWLVFIGALLVAPNLISIANIVPHYHFSWLDAFATAAVVFGPAIVLLAFVASLLLASIESAGERWRSQLLGLIPRALVLALLLGAWLRLLRGMLKVNRVELALLDRPFELWVAPAIALLLLVFARTSVSGWVDKTAPRVRVVGALVVVAALGLSGYVLVERFDRGARAPVELKQPGRELPNVVVIVLDALTSHDMSLYGYALPTTPNLDRLARSWTVYEQAQTSSTATLGIQPAILTGRYPYFSQWHRYGDLARAGKGVLNLAQVLRSFGYETTYFMGGGWSPSRYHLHYGFDRILGAGYAGMSWPNNPIHTFPGRDLANLTLWNPTVAEAVLLPRYGGLTADTTTIVEPMYDTADRYFRQQARADRSAPFFAYLHMSRPHHPYLANEFRGQFLPIDQGLADVGSQVGELLRHYSPQDQPTFDRLKLRYDENILKADQQVGALIDTLRQLDLYDSSLNIVTADHGANFTQGYEGYFTPLLSAAEQSVPLLVKYPYQTEGRRVRGAVSSVDILPTVLDVVGASYPATWVDGQSLLQAGQNPNRVVLTQRLQLEANVDVDTVAAVSGDMKLVRRKGQELLFNLADDPQEQVNLLGRSPADNLRAALDRFARRRAFIREGGDITAAPSLDDEQRQGPKARARTTKPAEGG